MEELEGGVIRESKTGMAATTRADMRKQHEAPDGGLHLLLRLNICLNNMPEKLIA